MNDHATTLALVDAMKARGVRSFTVGDTRVEFGPAAEAPLRPDSKAPSEDDRCACGHEQSDHMNGLCCRNDCDPAKCAEKTP